RRWFRARRTRRCARAPYEPPETAAGGELDGVGALVGVASESEDEPELELDDELGVGGGAGAVVVVVVVVVVASAAPVLAAVAAPA
ncbi:MAG: hypothetical protein QOE36_3248, partial [Gaiellaceae bacterium]|nr:hypothetical protein [Gaiellaceae bacterium]